MAPIHGPLFTAVRPSHEVMLWVGHHWTALGGSLRPLRKSRAHTACGVNITASGSAYLANAVHWPIFCASRAKAYSVSTALGTAAAISSAVIIDPPDPQGRRGGARRPEYYATDRR